VGLNKRMIMKNNDNELNETIIKESQINSRKLHLVLKDRTYRNGYVISFTDSSFIFEDDRNGKEQIFFLDLYKVTYFTKPMEERE
jgi:hypothetical protein